MTVVELPRRQVDDPPRAVDGPGRWGGVLLFVALGAVYFTVGYLLLMRYNLFDPDAPSRVANAGYVIQSRDPHLSAVGFVWNPLPSLVEVPMVQLAHWWPQLRSHGLSAVVQSAAFMSAAGVVVRRIALDRGVGAGWRWLAVGCFALHPMIVVYGASGMSEAAETFAILWCARNLLRWNDTRSPRDLAWAGLALAVGYLARYEVVPAALGAAAFVAAVTMFGAGHGRLTRTLAYSAIILFPMVVTAAVWALSGWVVNQELFAPITSQYGNASQVSDAIQKGYISRDTSSQWVVIAARMLGMQPFLLLATAGAVAYAALSRRYAAVVPVLTFGPVVAFAIWGQYTATTFGWFRFYLLAVPMVVCVALALWPVGTASPAPRRVGAALLCASVLVGFPVTARAMLNERIGNQVLQSGFNSLLHSDQPGSQGQWYRRLMADDRLLADYLDRLRLPDGAVLMDSFNTWGVWLSSENPKQFIVTSDYDFKAALNRPWEYGVQFLVVSNPKDSNADALNVRYPTLWNDGAGMSNLVYTVYGASGEERFRLYRVTGPPRSVQAGQQGAI